MIGKQLLKQIIMVMKFKRLAGSAWEKIGFVQSNNDVGSNQYSFTDKSLTTNGTANYRIKQYGKAGTFSYSKIVSVQFTKANAQAFDNYPNPFIHPRILALEFQSPKT